MNRSRAVEEVVRRDVPLGPLTSWRVGGVAGEFAEAHDVESAQEALRGFRSERVAILGAGSNVLVDDHLPDTAVLRIHTAKGSMHIGPDDGLVVVDAGVPMPRLARHVARDGLAGLEFLGGIPGTVGGGVIMNAGTGGIDGPCMADIVEWVEVLQRDGSLRRHLRHEIDWSYRHCSIGREGALVVRAALRVRPGDDDDPLAVIATNLKGRREKQPIGTRNAGSVFLPVDGVPAAVWVDKAGLKGHRVGGASVSAKHANWIEADPSATAADVRFVIEHVQRTVHDRFGIELDREVRYFPSEAVVVAGDRTGPADAPGPASSHEEGHEP